ncbi:hypothetical protein RH08_04145 [Candidatus Liberibacter asiaticus]|nr:hypothetical protein B2I23_04160 [Candidatus Liberibacter asiaticus]AWL14294.1 hypothetical protein DIC79_04185 [Candidatus Liberibacter asiaticus]KAE9514155.1 hypothetical protein FXW25_03930 [Candidatus Liberibacter asiaticus]KAE9515225.1 hypothetical protein FXW26_03935 [Candidatus Liberibacter asiaticus]KAE9516266.1 hypothetical protein FXW27_03965 [Candidatus Liberibacter asiaticus]
MLKKLEHNKRQKPYHDGRVTKIAEQITKKYKKIGKIVFKKVIGAIKRLEKNINHLSYQE